MKSLCMFACLLLARLAAADVCEIHVNATDLRRFEQPTLELDPQCTEVQVTLHHTGKLPARAMGHDWVLTKTTDMVSVANAGMGAGLVNNYQKPGDPRIVAATPIIGGGETSTVKFSTARLEPGISYSYFCSAPGHVTIMKGRLVYNPAASPKVAKAQ